MLAHPPAAVGAIATTCAIDWGGVNDSVAATAITRTAFLEKPVGVRIAIHTKLAKSAPLCKPVRQFG
jgi:hypothetical protein